MAERSGPRVSVLVPAYNRADYIVEAVSSVLAQTLSGLEVVVIDDGSTDNTGDIVRSIPDPRVRCIRQENRGVAAALNTAWRSARAGYLAMLGSDDVMLPRQLETLVPLLDADPGLGLVYARAQGMDSQGRPLPQILGAPLKFPGDALKSLVYGDCICGIACVFRRACLERAGGFDERMIGNEDWDLWIRMAEICRMAYVDAVLARYRMHPQSLTGGRSARYERIILDRVRLIENYYSRTDLPRSALEVRPLALRNVYMDVMIRFLAIGRPGRAFPYFARALRSAPDPVASAFRIAAVALFDLYLSKTAWGVRLVEAFVSWRRGLSRAGD